MINKTIFIKLILFINITKCIYGETLEDFLKRIYSSSRGNFEYIWERKITEHDVPMPDIQFDLPKELIGEFIMTSSFVNIEITIFPNNKFIILYWLPGHFPSEYYGYITKIDNYWYFASYDGRDNFNYKFFNSLTPIYLNRTEFSFFHINEN
jgi:hypothetical protein